MGRVLKLDACVCGGEPPIDGRVASIPIEFLCTVFLAQNRRVGDIPIEALAA
jgi:hypothetical protein